MGAQTGAPRSRPTGHRVRGRRVIAGVILALLILPLLAVPSRGSTTLDVTVDGTGGGRANTPGIACADGGDGAYWHHDYRGDVPDGTLNGRPAELRTHLDVHSDTVRFPGLDPAATGQPLPDGPAAWLAGTDSRTTFVDDRGTLQFALESGDCDTPTLDFDGVTATGGGTWTVHHGTGAYEGATGAGTFALTAELGPTATEALSIDLDGPIEVLRPSLSATVVETFWGGLGADYLSRRPSVVIRIVNEGPGTAFGAELVDVYSPTLGASAIGAIHAQLGDLEPGQAAFVTRRFQLGLLTPCALVLLGCDFEAGITVAMPDVLDDPVVDDAVMPAEAPDLPPPL